MAGQNRRVARRVSFVAFTFELVLAVKGSPLSVSNGIVSIPTAQHIPAEYIYSTVLDQFDFLIS